jgi:hypothetical protein
MRSGLEPGVDEPLAESSATGANLYESIHALVLI